MTLLNAKHSSRAIPLFSAVAALMSLLTAAAGPFSQTVKVVRVAAASEQGQSDAFELVVSAIDAAPERAEQRQAANRAPRAPGKPEKAPNVVQPLSGHWESAAQIHAPLADVPATVAFLRPRETAASAFESLRSDNVASQPVPIKAGRAPPRI